MCQFGSRSDFGGEPFLLLRQCTEVALDLDAVPELRGLGEKGTEADGHGRGDGALAEHDFVDGARGHADSAGHGVLRNAHGLKIFLQEDLAGCDGKPQCHNEMPNSLKLCYQGYKRCSQ